MLNNNFNNKNTKVNQWPWPPLQEVPSYNLQVMWQQQVVILVSYIINIYCAFLQIFKIFADKRCFPIIYLVFQLTLYSKLCINCLGYQLWLFPNNCCHFVIDAFLPGGSKDNPVDDVSKEVNNIFSISIRSKGTSI